MGRLVGSLEEMAQSHHVLPRAKRLDCLWGCGNNEQILGLTLSS
jgi:hypothetical protein